MQTQLFDFCKAIFLTFYESKNINMYILTVDFLKVEFLIS